MQCEANFAYLCRRNTRKRKRGELTRAIVSSQASPPLHRRSTCGTPLRRPRRYPQIHTSKLFGTHKRDLATSCADRASALPRGSVEEKHFLESPAWN